MSVGTAASFFCGVLVLGIGVFGLLVAMFVQARRLRAAQAHEEADLRERAHTPLFVGPARVARGRVEPATDDDVAVEIDIEQLVRNRAAKNNSEWHEWNEVSRTVRAAPFYLVRDDGVSVYVEPDEDVLVVDTLATVYPNDQPMRRTRAADVRRGEEFYAYGELAQGPHPRAQAGYRDSLGWILRPPKSGRMLLATDGIRERYTARASFLSKSALVLGLILLPLHAVFTGPFAAATVFGARMTAEVTQARTYVVHGKHGPETHYALTARSDDGFTLGQDVPSDTYYAAVREKKANAAVIVPIVRVGDSTWASYIGEPYVSGLWLGLCTVFLAMTLGLLRVQYRRKYAWYDQKKLVEHGGAGRWEETRPRMPIDPSMN